MTAHSAQMAINAVQVLKIQSHDHGVRGYWKLKTRS